MSKRWWYAPAGRCLLVAALLALAGWSEAGAQTTTGTIRGRVLTESGQPAATAQVVARNVATGAARNTIANAEGAYMLVGLPPASYELNVEMMGYRAEPRTVRVLIGQTLIMDLQLAPQAIQLEGISVVGTRAIETRTSEMATNVTEEQLESLPQADRNFLNFAGLAPGVTVSRDELNKNISAGGLSATKINVFVDGASYKNDVLEGGVHGQDASRGNPFPQIALQEFRVITQNFKAEYQRAASAIVTATTKSGTNELEVNGFVLGQNKDLVAINPGLEVQCDRDKENNPNHVCAPKPEYERLQMGLSIGGPIVRDKFHYFAAYEGNVQNRQAIVAVGQEALRQQFAAYEGTFDQPFRSHLAVAKLSYQSAQNQTLDLSWHGRFETDKRGFGGTTSFESAEDVRINYNVVNLQHSLSSGNWFNQAQISAQRSTWNPTAVNDEQTIGLNYENVIRIGARSTEQKFVQDRIALRNDLSRLGLEWNGSHVFKGGVNVDFLNYDVQKRFDGNPQFTFNPATSMTVPIRANWGNGDPGMNESNIQFGWYLQDDWDVTPQLQLNLGVRWDAETNMFNNEWDTPDSVRTRLGPVLDLLDLDRDNYFTDGREDRPIYLGAFQPRFGFSYALTPEARTVIHGGFGIYYDREIWNHLIDERFRLQWGYRTAEFTASPATEPNKIPWQQSYLSVEGLRTLENQVRPGLTSEIFLLKNDSKPPRSNQWNLGVRQTVRDFVVGAAYRGVRGSHLTSWYCAKAHSEHGYCEGTQEAPFSSPYKVLLSTDEGKTKYDALDVTFEKPFSVESRWGFTMAYTFAAGERKGMDFFTLEFPDVDPADWRWINTGVEKHRLSASGMVGLPCDFVLSSLVQLGSGVKFSRRDETIGWGPRRQKVDWFSEAGDAFKQVDLRLQKDIQLPGQGRVGLVVEAINLFDWANYRNYQEFSNWGGGAVNDNFRQPELWSADPGQRIQLGLNFGF